MYLRRYTSVASETWCAVLWVCDPSTHGRSGASAAMLRPPWRAHHPPRSISGPQKWAGGVCFACISAATPPLHLKLGVRCCECVLHPVTAAEQPARQCYAHRDV